MDRPASDVTMWGNRYVVEQHGTGLLRHAFPYNVAVSDDRGRAWNASVSGGTHTVRRTRGG